MCELLATALEVVAVLSLDGVLDGRGHGVVRRQNGTLNELDLTGHATLQATAGSSNSTTGLLALSPGLGRAGLAPLIWRGCAVGTAKVTAFTARGVVGIARVLCRAVGHICL